MSADHAGLIFENELRQIPEIAKQIKDYADSKGFSVLGDINPGEGFWVNCTGAIIL